MTLTFSRSGGASVEERTAHLAGSATLGSPPVAVTVGGASGQRFDLTGPSRLSAAQTRWTELQADQSARVWVVNAGGRIVTISVVGPTAEFDAWVALAEEVLATVRFE